jgi:hypothetical protein
MHEAHRTPKQPERSDRLDAAILGLLVNPDDQRPWSEREIAREISTPGNVRDSLERLHHAGLTHHYSGLVSATHAAVRLYDIEQVHDHCEQQRSLEETILMLLLAHPDTDTPLSRRDVIGELGEDREIMIVDALDSLTAAGLIDRTGELLSPTLPARQLDQLRP